MRLLVIVGGLWLARRYERPFVRKETDAGPSRAGRRRSRKAIAVSGCGVIALSSALVVIGLQLAGNASQLPIPPDPALFQIILPREISSPAISVVLARDDKDYQTPGPPSEPNTSIDILSVTSGAYLTNGQWQPYAPIFDPSLAGQPYIDTRSWADPNRFKMLIDIDGGYTAHGPVAAAVLTSAGSVEHFVNQFGGDCNGPYLLKQPQVQLDGITWAVAGPKFCIDDHRAQLRLELFLTNQIMTTTDGRTVGDLPVLGFTYPTGEQAAIPFSVDVQPTYGDDFISPLYDSVSIFPAPVTTNTLHWTASEPMEATWGWTDPALLAQSQEETILDNIGVAILASALVMLIGVLVREMLLDKRPKSPSPV